MKRLFVLFIIFLSCQEYDNPYDNPDEFIIGVFGQSNATPELAESIAENSQWKVVHSYHGGNSIQKWYNNGIQQNLIDNLQAAGNSLTHIVWFQGESDNFPELIPQYKKAFLGMRNIFLASYPGIKMIICKIFSPRYDMGLIRDIQQDIADHHDDVLIYDTIGYEREPPAMIHLTHDEYIRLGKDLVDYILEI